MVSLSAGFAAFVVVTALTLALPVVAFWALYKVCELVFFIVGGAARIVGRGGARIGRFVRGEVVDALHLAGGVVTAGVILPLSLANVLIGRFAAARHYGRALEDELMSSAVSLYRIALGHPVRLLGLGVLTEGVERRIPDLVARAPRTGVVPARRAAKTRFEGYDVVREMVAGGSGARLFLARPRPEKARELAQKGHTAASDVVIKCFDRSFGSTLPQIVRESRALEAAKRLGHVLEHALDDEHFHYVMPFVPGDDLDVVTRKLHASAGERGLDRRAIAKVVGYASDLCATLERFHAEGLWHKDIKPTNLLVSADRLQVVDLGLVTPLASALTLTTHGTEYFRDPELVRLAMRGVKVHEVDGVKFDVYSAGAVLFSMLENSFPAHGSLSRLTKPVPEALAWIVRRAMSDVSRRYPTARAMGRDLAAVMAAGDPFALRPADLPSFAAQDDACEAQPAPRAALASRPADVTEVPVAAAPPQAGAAHRETPPTAGTQRRTLRRRLVGAYGLVAMVLCIAGGAAVFHLRSDAQYAQVFAQAREHTLREHAASEARFRRPNPAAPAVSLGRVLVYADPRVATSPALEPFVSRVVEHGFTPVGLGATDAEIEWLAAVGRFLAGAAPGDDAAKGRLERWLGLHGDELAAVLWLTPGSDPDAVAGELIASDDGGALARTLGPPRIHTGADVPVDCAESASARH